MRTLLIALLSSVASLAAAQEPTLHPPREPSGAEDGSGGFGGAIGGSVGLAQPAGTFASLGRLGPSVSGFVRLQPGGWRGFGVRAQVEWLQYGHDSRDEVVDIPNFGPLGITVSRTNALASFVLGPEWALRRGPVRPYVGAGGGFGYVYTSSSISAQDPNQSDFVDGTRTPLHDWVWTYGLQGGLGIPLGRRQQYLLDLGVSYTATSQARFYGRDPNDPAALTGPHLGHVQIVSYRIGFAVQ